MKEDKSKAAPDNIGARDLQAFADCGYYKSVEIKACDDAGIETFVPKPMTSNAKAHGRYGKDDLIYIASDDEYRVSLRIWPSVKMNAAWCHRGRCHASFTPTKSIRADIPL